MKLSICLVIHNEANVLKRCLESVKKVADEIIVVHDGSCTDGSLEIAKEFGAKIFIRPFIGEAEYHRPYSFEKASGEWILQIDADEFLSEKAKKEIKELIQNTSIDAYSFLWPYPDKNGYITRGPFAKTLKPCLFRKEKMFMVGISHEYPRTFGRLEKRPDILLEHQPDYDNFTFKAFREKWMSWADLQARQIYEIQKAPTLNIPKEIVRKGFSYYVFMRNHLILSGIGESIRFLLIYLSRGLLWSGKRSIKITLLELSYLWLVRLNLIKLKYGRRI
jgi:glycosyltransferase involved in cell wall biosynthesis